MKLTWFGTNSLILEAGGERIGIDPFFELKGGENPCSPEDCRNTGTFLITHGHFDHLVFMPELLEEKDADFTVFCTKTPAATLEKYCEDTDTVAQIAPGMAFLIGPVRVKVLQGRHIHFDRKLIARTLLSPRMLRYFGNLPFLLWGFTHYPENGETLVYELEAENRRIQILGSLGLDEKEHYEPGADLLVMPYQGSSDLEKAADLVLARLRPKRVLLTHFDDAFPPVSSHVPLAGLKKLMKKKYPHIQVVRPVCGKPVHLVSTGYPYAGISGKRR